MIDAACTRTADFRDVVLGAWMVLPRAFRTAPCPELAPYLRAGFPYGWPEAARLTPAQAKLAGFVANRDELWQTDTEARTQTLRPLGLPTDRAVWRELAERPRPITSGELFGLQSLMGVRMPPPVYLGDGFDRTNADLLRRAVEKLLDAYDQATVDGEITEYRLTIESDDRIVLAVDGAALSVDTWKATWNSTFTRMFTALHLSHSGRTNAMETLAVTSAFCSTITAETWYAGHRYTQRFAEMVAIEPIQVAGPAETTGYRAVLDLDTEWLPPGAAVPCGLDDRPSVTDLRART